MIGHAQDGAGGTGMGLDPGLPCGMRNPGPMRCHPPLAVRSRGVQPTASDQAR
jgi:hypothetical protein